MRNIKKVYLLNTRILNLRGLRYMSNIKNVYLLDRNMISHIKKINENQNINEEVFNRLKGIDKDNNLISPLVAIIEGQSGQKQSCDQMINCIKEDTILLKNFFKNAKTDYDFFQQHAKDFVEAFISDGEKNRNHIKLIKEIQEKLYQPLGKEKKELLKKYILKYAEDHNIPVAHPTIICCLALLYRNPSSHKILKPKQNIEDIERHTYNSYSDIFSICYCLEAIGEINRGSEPSIKVSFLTEDKGLEKFIKQIHPRNVSPLMPVKSQLLLPDSCKKFRSEHSLTFDKNLFPDLNDSEFEKLKEELLRIKEKQDFAASISI